MVIFLFLFFSCNLSLSFIIIFQVRKIRVEKRVNEIVNRLNKTKVEKKPDLRQEREQRDREERENKKQLLKEQKEREREEEKRKQADAELRYLISN